MKNTVFTEKHIALGAKMAPFAGYNMPIQYKGINEEHTCVREGVGVFDVSHMGEIWVCGPKALPFIQYVSSNDASVLFPGKAQYTCFPNGKGGIVDDFILYCFSTEKYLLAVNAANIVVYVDMKDAQPGLQQFQLQVDQPTGGLVRYSLNESLYELNVLGETNSDSDNSGASDSNND